MDNKKEVAKETPEDMNKHADTDGHFRRKASQFRGTISKDPSAEFPAEAGRYVLYMNWGCPWAHRTILVHELKGLEEIVKMYPCDFEKITNDGWLFTGRNGSLEQDPVYGFTNFKQLYKKADPSYEGRYTVPCLWDTKTHTIVNNESSEIIRMFYTEFDNLLPEELREPNRPGGGFYPVHLRDEIDAMNDWVYHTVNNGVYKTGFATTQKAYNDNIYPLFESLDRLDAHLAPGNPANHGGPYLFGAHLTEADIRLFTTLIRFDAAYHTCFMCNRKMIRHDYKNLYRWLRLIYWRGGEPYSTPGHDRTTAVKDSCWFQVYKVGYAMDRHQGVEVAQAVVPAGPTPDIDPLDDEDEDEKVHGAGGASAIAAKIENLKFGEGIRDATAAVFAQSEEKEKNGV